jgi:uncharacterized protein YjiS (DUF1127 family)
MVQSGAEKAEAGNMRNDGFGIGQPAANAEAETPPTEATIRRLASGPGRWLLRALSTRTPDLRGFSDAQLRDIGLTRADVEAFR